MMKLIRSILINNSGVSVKNLVALWGVAMGTIIILVICIVIIYNMFHKYEIDYQGIAILLGSTATLVISSVTLKIFGEKYETRYQNHENFVNYETHETNYNTDTYDGINSGV